VPIVAVVEGQAERQERDQRDREDEGITGVLGTALRKRVDFARIVSYRAYSRKRGVLCGHVKG